MVTAIEPWPEDPAFLTLAHKIRDGVMLAEHRGFEISISRGVGCCCPLGAVLILNQLPRPASHPSPHFALTHFASPRRVRFEAYPDEKMIWAFICGFEEGIESRSHNYAVKAAGRLGIVYRKRYLKKKEARFDPRPRRQRLNLTTAPERR